MKNRRGGSNLRSRSRETRGRTGAKRGPSDTRLETEVLREVLLCGREMEASGRHLEAMALYDEAMEVADGDMAPFEVGSILHHVGHRATAVGDGRRALVSYVNAARLFQRHQLAGYCADSLAAAGTAVVDCGGDPPLERAIEEDGLRLGLDDVLSHARDVLLAVEAPTYDGAMAAHGRLSGLLVVAGQAGYDAPLAAIATALARDVVNPYVERYGVVVRTELDVFVVVAHLSKDSPSSVWLSRSRSSRGEWGRGRPPSRSSRSRASSRAPSSAHRTRAWHIGSGRCCVADMV